MGCVRLQTEFGKQYIKQFTNREAVKKYKLLNQDKVKEYHKQYYQKNKKTVF